MGQGRGVFSFNINILPRSYTFVKREYKGTVRIDSNSGQFITRKKGELWNGKLSPWADEESNTTEFLRGEAAVNLIEPRQVQLRDLSCLECEPDFQF